MLEYADREVGSRLSTIKPFYLDIPSKYEKPDNANVLRSLEQIRHAPTFDFQLALSNRAKKCQECLAYEADKSLVSAQHFSRNTICTHMYVRQNFEHFYLEKTRAERGHREKC